VGCFTHGVFQLLYCCSRFDLSTELFLWGGSRVIREYAGHRRQVADVSVHHAEQSDDGGLVGHRISARLVLCWEVGSFIPIGHAAFSYFSINEHVAFAASALPVVLVFAAMKLPARSIAVLMGERLFPVMELEAGAPDGPVRKRFRVVVIAAFTVQVGLLLLGVYLRQAIIITGSTLVLILLCLVRYIGMSEVYALLVIGALLVSTSVGVDSTRAHINGTCCSSLIQTTDGDVSGVVIRTGERGLLFLILPRTGSCSKSGNRSSRSIGPGSRYSSFVSDNRSSSTPEFDRLADSIACPSAAVDAPDHQQDAADLRQQCQ